MNKNKKKFFITALLCIVIAGGFLLSRRTPQPAPEMAASDIKTEPSAAEPVSLMSEFDHIETKIPILTYEGGQLDHLPALPVLDEGCEGETCGQAKDLKVTRETVLLSDADEKSNPVLSLPVGESVQKARLFVKILKTAKLRNQGGTVLRYGAEGFYSVVRPDMSVDSIEVAEEDAKGLESEEWVYLETLTGKHGWAKYKSVDGDSTSTLFALPY